MVINPSINDLEAIITMLEQRVVSDPDGPVWLWQVRIRVLRHLASIARSRRDDSPPPIAPSSPGHWLKMPANPVMPSYWTNVEHPPRVRQQLSPSLDHIRELNNASHAAHGVLQPDDAWEWFANSQTRGLFP